MSAESIQLFTIGHGAASEDAFVALLQAASIGAVVDVRIAPGSRKHPHFGKDRLAQSLPAAGIGYRWEKALGGFRKLSEGSPDVALRNTSFRAYAGYMRSDEFLGALEQLLEEAARVRAAIMCSETVWWRCHRRLIADNALLVRGVDVQHIMPPGKLSPHKPTSGVRVCDGGLVYDVVEQPELFSPRSEAR